MGEKQARLAYGLLIGAGWAGAHRFYLQRYASAAAQLLLTLLMVALWSWGGRWASYAPYLLGPILLWLGHDGFWLYDYFRVEEEMDTQLAGFVDSGRAPLVRAAPLAAAVKDEAPSPEETDTQKKARAIKLTKKQIAQTLHDNHPKGAHTAAERLVQYLQQRSRRPQHDPHLAEAYLLHGMVLYQTQYLEAARKKLQMGVHLAAPFAHLSVQTQQAQGWLDRLRNPQLQSPAGAGAVQVEPGQYEALMRAGDWQRAAPLCAQIIAMRQSAKAVDVSDLAEHHLNAMEIAHRLGDPGQVQAHGVQLLQLASQSARTPAGQSPVPELLQRQAMEKLGDLAYARGDTAGASQYYRDALALLARNAGSGAQICGVLQRLALNSERAGDIPGALDYWRIACEHIATMGDVMEDNEAVSDVLTRYAAFSVRHQPAKVKPLIEQSLRIQHRAYRGYSLAAARAYEVFAGFMAEVGQPAAHLAHLQKALLLYQVCDPDNISQIAAMKESIVAAQAVAQAAAGEVRA